MKLLLDQNISRKLVKTLGRSFPGTSHVHTLGLSTASDLEVWEYARTHEYIIVTQDSDFSERIAVHGHPPKVVWLRVGNTSTQHIKTLLAERRKDILAFGGCPTPWVSNTECLTLITNRISAAPHSDARNLQINDS